MQERIYKTSEYKMSSLRVQIEASKDNYLELSI